MAIVEFDEGYTGTVGTKDAYMQFTCTTLRFAGTGQAFLNLEASAISPEIRKTAVPASAASKGLYLKGSALATLTLAGNASVGVAAFGGETATVATARVVSGSASLLLGAGVTLTTCQVTAGQAEIRCAGTTLDIQGGTVTTLGTGTWTTVTVDAGTLYPYGTGTITTMNLNGGTVDRLTTGQAATVTTMNHFGGVLRYDENVTTVTTYNRKDGPSQITVSDP